MTRYQIGQRNRWLPWLLLLLLPLAFWGGWQCRSCEVCPDSQTVNTDTVPHSGTRPAPVEQSNSPPAISEADLNTTVYITRWGHKYHDYTHYKSHARSAITLREALEQEYTPCRNCRVPDPNNYLRRR